MKHDNDNNKKTNVVTINGDEVSQEDIEYNLEQDKLEETCVELLSQCKDKHFTSISLVAHARDGQTHIMSSDRDMSKLVFMFEHAKIRVLSE